MVSWSLWSPWFVVVVVVVLVVLMVMGFMVVVLLFHRLGIYAGTVLLGLGFRIDCSSCKLICRDKKAGCRSIQYGV